MQFSSTRGGVQPTSLSEAIALGAAPDGGLFVPLTLPRLSSSWKPRTASPAESARTVLGPFFQGDALEPQLEAICTEAFGCELPIVSLGSSNDMALELFHGPTAAFKDFGARFLAACLRRMGGLPLTVLVATSGDTGSAVAAAFHRAPGVDVVLLYPDGRVSRRQAHQLGCFGDNVTALRVAGSFDDCQRMVKAAFLDPELHQRLRLTSANSINLGRLLPQMAFHAHAAWKHAGLLNLIIPTGNLGDGVAAVWAREAGAPIGDIVLATNANRVLADFFQGGRFTPRPCIPTLASAMDVGSPSNFERLRWTFPDDAALTTGLTAIAVEDSEIQQTIQLGERRHGQVFCPHTATAVRALEAVRAAGDRRPWAVVATAHPAKFETVVEPLVGHPVPIPASLAALLARPARAEPLDAQPSALRTWLLARVRG
ncbi:MAG: threonine synthase [Myxococcaceae bacterium]